MQEDIYQYREVLTSARRIVLLTQGHTTLADAKTAANLIRYRRGDIVGVLDSDTAGLSTRELLGVPFDVPIAADLESLMPADTLVIGTAIASGALGPQFRHGVTAAIDRGLNIVSGLHVFLNDDEALVERATRSGSRLIDLRRSQHREVATRKDLDDRCTRILTVGHDCGCGKMVAGVELDAALRNAGIDSQFIATGQTGMLLSGTGLVIDSVVADFIAGAAEKLVRSHQAHDVLVIEGQGSLAHPSFSGVTMGLLHGSAPHAMIFCYEAERPHVKGLPHIPLVPLSTLIPFYEQSAALLSPAPVIGVALNSRRLTACEATWERDRLRDQLGLPTCDVIRDGCAELTEAIRCFVDSRRVTAGGAINHGAAPSIIA